MSIAESLAVLNSEYEASVGRIHGKILRYQKAQRRAREARSSGSNSSGRGQACTLGQAGAEMLRAGADGTWGADAAATFSARALKRTGSARSAFSEAAGNPTATAETGLGGDNRCAQMLAQLPHVATPRFPDNWEGVSADWAPRDGRHQGRPAGPGVWWPPAAPPQHREKQKRRKPSLFDTKDTAPISLTRKNPRAMLTVARDTVKTIIPMPKATTPAATPREWDGAPLRKDSLRTPPHSNRTELADKNEFHIRPGEFATFVNTCVLRHVNWTSTNHDTDARLNDKQGHNK